MRITIILAIGLYLFGTGLGIGPALADDVKIGIRTSIVERIPLNIAPFAAVDGARPDDAGQLENFVAGDLEFAGVFRIQRGILSLARADEHDGLVEVRGNLVMRGDEPYFEGYLIDVVTRKQILGKRYKTTGFELRRVAHHFVDEIVEALTGEQGIATTQILYRRRSEEFWEIVMCDYDGYNPRVVVRQNVPLMFPRWVNQDEAIAYTSFRYGKPDLFLRYLNETASNPFASYDGVNYVVDWSRKRDEMVASLSKDGNPEIYILDAKGKIKRRLTHSRAIDTSPSWSPTGNEVVFTSDRLGVPMIFMCDADGSNPHRLTYEGNYNESAAWSPKGDLICFVSRIDGFFQICTIRPDGTDYRQLTTDPVNHEDPRWAPNGRHIVYAEGQGAQTLISIVDIGTGGKRILGEGETPDWSF